MDPDTLNCGVSGPHSARVHSSMPHCVRVVSRDRRDASLERSLNNLEECSGLRCLALNFPLLAHSLHPKP